MSFNKKKLTLLYVWISTVCLLGKVSRWNQIKREDGSSVWCDAWITIRITVWFAQCFIMTVGGWMSLVWCNSVVQKPSPSNRHLVVWCDKIRPVRLSGGGGTLKYPTFGLNMFTRRPLYFWNCCILYISKGVSIAAKSLSGEHHDAVITLAVFIFHCWRIASAKTSMFFFTENWVGCIIL